MHKQTHMTGEDRISPITFVNFYNKYNCSSGAKSMK